MRTKSKLKPLSPTSMSQVSSPPSSTGNGVHSHSLPIHLYRSIIFTFFLCSRVWFLPWVANLPKLIQCGILTGCSSSRTVTVWVHTMGSILQEWAFQLGSPMGGSFQPDFMFHYGLSRLHLLPTFCTCVGSPWAPAWALHGPQPLSGQIQLLYCGPLHGLQSGCLL